MPQRQRMTTRLKTLFQRPELFVLAGGINPIGAKMAEALGYDAFYMSGGNTSAHQLGWPDSGTSMRDMVDNARKIVLTVQIPVFADADTGYGDAISTHYTVREYIQAGIAGAHIEDQTFPPKSGPRRRCISIPEMVGKLRAAMDAKQDLDPDFVIMARCDLGGVPGASFAEIIERCQAYKAEAQVDVVCPKWPTHLGRNSRGDPPHSRARRPAHSRPPVAISLLAGAAGCRGRRGLVPGADHHGRPAGQLGFLE